MREFPARDSYKEKYTMLPEGQIGPQTKQDGSPSVLRQAKDGSLVVRDDAGRYTESALRGNLYTLFSGELTGAAAFNKESAAGTIKLICGIFNPTGSGVSAVIVDAVLSIVEGTKMSGPFVYGYQQCPAITSATTGTVRALNVGNSAASKMVAQNNVAVVRQDGATTTFNIARLLGGSANKESALTASVPEQRDRPEGSIVVPPGTVFGINTWAAGTESKFMGSLTWEEIAG
jgi:hypothetical protein